MACVELHADARTGVATIKLNRPEVLNAIDVELARALHEATLSLERRQDVRCIVLTGAGRAFSAGGDVREFGDRLDDCSSLIDELLDALNPVVLSLATHAAPVIASVRGVAAGAGLSLVAGCDYIIAADNARFQMAYDKVGAPPDCGGTWHLPHRVGYVRAAELMLLGAAWTAADALAAGLADRVVMESQLDEKTMALAKRLAAGPTHAFGQWKQLAREQSIDKLAAHLEEEREAFKRATRTEDFREGVLAFLERRPANFSGR